MVIYKPVPVELIKLKKGFIIGLKVRYFYTIVKLFKFSTYTLYYTYIYINKKK
jgi:hypothetical protein